MIQTDLRNMRRMEADLALFARSALPFATKQTINQAVVNTAKVAKDFVRGRMTLRNAWTLRSIQYDRARGNAIGEQAARVGSVQPYMATQEFGGVKHAQGARGVPIATPAASGESSIPRRRLPRRANSLASIRLQRSQGAAANRAQRNRIAVSEAVAGARFAFLELGRKSGIYRVAGSAARPRLKKVWDMSRASVAIPATPWLEPAVAAITPHLATYYSAALLAQLRRARVFGY